MTIEQYRLTRLRDLLAALFGRRREGKLHGYDLGGCGVLPSFLERLALFVSF
ncbi:hypothetical protein LP414_24815 [Polaromonas sp. P1(28)-13]|nr:hypothetical protein LP414_24815 [Polaromonas sp. P1(28)-13]